MTYRRSLSYVLRIIPSKPPKNDASPLPAEPIIPPVPLTELTHISVKSPRPIV